MKGMGQRQKDSKQALTVVQAKYKNGDKGRGCEKSSDCGIF